jgi:hypothetical protein
MGSALAHFGWHGPCSLQGMGKQIASTSLIVLMASMLAPASIALAAHRAENEIPFSHLFKNATPARIGRTLSSSPKATKLSPSLTFTSRIPLNASGEAKLGRACFVRDVTHVESAGHAYYNSVLGQAPGSRIESGVVFELGLIAFQYEALQLQLVSRTAPVQRLELGCSHPNIQAWSVADFEAYSGHKLNIRVPHAIRELQTKKRISPRELLTLKDLKGFRYNAAFGSGLPGTSGIQLLFGANLRAYAEETDASLMVGRRCQMVSQKEKSINARYLKGSKFAFLGYLPKPESKTVELVFGNWNHSPRQIRLECIGSESEVKALSFQEIEQDLNGAIRFYKK